MSLSEWFAQAVGQYAAQVGTEPANLNEDDRVEAIAVQLHRLGIRGPNGGAPPARRAKPRFSRSFESGAAEDALLERALARLDEPADIEALAYRFDHLEAELGHTGRGVLQPHYENQLDRLESKVNSLCASLAASAGIPDSVVGGRRRLASSNNHPSLGNAIAEITRRQRALEDTGSDRTHQDRRVPQRDTADAFAQSSSTTIESLRGDISALAAQLQGMRREQTERSTLPPGACNLDKLHAEIATMSDGLRDFAARDFTAPLEAAIRNLTQQIETSRNEGIREAVLQPLERLAGDLRLALAEVDPRTTIRGLEGEVKKLSIKLDDLGKYGFDPSALAAIDTRTKEIREFLSAGVAADGFRQLASDHGGAALTKIEGQLDTIAAKVDEALVEARDDSRYTALANRINDVHLELAERMAQGVPQLDMHALENLVRSLAERIEQARGPEADTRAIAALQKQVGEFASRLDQANVGIPSLVSLEQSIGNLFAELERTRDISYETAEKAARSALEQALATSASGFKQSDVAHDLDDLRNMQDVAGRRTFATLNAVHETLEKVVDRLAMVETEIADVRGQRPPDFLASGPAPNFAPVPGRATAPFTAPKAAPARRADRRAPKGPAAAEKENPGVQGDMLDDFLIEPGRGFPGQRDPLSDETGEFRQGGTAPDHLDVPEANSGHAGFIAAARRAAQVAQKDPPAMPRRAAAQGAGARPASLIGQTRNFLSQHKRPLVLSVAALFLVVSAYALLKTVNHTPLIDFSFMGSKDTPVAGSALPHGAAAPTQTAPATGAATTSSSAPPNPTEANDSASKEKTAMLSIQTNDPIPTGVIGASPPGAYPPAYPPAHSSTHLPPPSPRETAPAILQSLAQAGNAKAQFELATDYAMGRGLPHDLSLAAQWYEKAAVQGLAPAQYHLGSLYEKGLGVRRDANEAMAWYRKAAEHGNVRAMHNLAVLTAAGGDSGKPDYAGAAQWFRKAAEYGVRDSQYNVAILLARGLGVPQNLALSYVWFAIAAAQGDEDAGNKRDDVGARLNAPDLAAAKATAAAFQAKVPDPLANEVAPPQGGWVAPPASTTNKARPKLSRM
jgi:localization factor PodJL